MKKILLAFITIGLLVWGMAYADSPNFWLLQSNYLKPLSSAWGLKLPNITSQCLHTNGSGQVSGAGNDCSSISSSSVATLILPLIANGTVAGVNATSSIVSFNVQGSGTLNPFNVASSSGTSELYVASSGNVGIGTTSPSQLLTVGNNNQFTVSNTGVLVAKGNSLFSNNGTTGDNQGILDVFKNAPSAGDVLFSVGTSAQHNQFVVKDETAVAFPVFGISAGNLQIGQQGGSSRIFDTQCNSAYIDWGAGSAPMTFRPCNFQDPGFNFITNNGNTTALSIALNTQLGVNSTTPGSQLSVRGISGNTYPNFTVASSTNAVQFTVLSNGNTGIGIIKPLDPLNIQTNSGGEGLVIVARSTGNIATEEFRQNDNSTLLGRIQGGTVYGPGIGLTGPNGNAVLQISSNAATFNYGVTFPGSGIWNASGSVGIGTTTPDSSLDVYGNVRFENSSSVVTPSIGGAIIGIGCDSATTSVDSTIASSTASFITTPQNDPGTSVTAIYSFLSSSGIITTRVCGNGITPNSTQYNVKIIK